MMPLNNMFSNPMQQQVTQNNPMANTMNLMQQFYQFGQNFSGDPRQMVMNLMSRGQLSQKQIGEYASMYQGFRNMFRR